MKWFEFRQNNSGGFYVENENVCEYVLIQAKNAKSALDKADSILDNSDSCPCCGDRWCFYVEDSDGTDVPSLYGTPLEECKQSLFIKKVMLHYADGKIETVNLRK